MSKNKGPRYKGSKKGYCNICCKYDKLTDDHVPPKGAAEPEPRDLHLFTEYVTCTPKAKTKHMQNGLYFRTLCPHCNNVLLGKQYDPLLKVMSKDVAQLTRAKFHNNLELPPEGLKIKTKPNRIARAVVGHTLAAQIRRDMTTQPKRSPFDTKLREYFLDENAKICESIELYWWIFLSTAHVILRNFHTLLLGERKVISGSLLKFYPFSFWIVWNRSTPIDQDFLLPLKGIKLDEEVEMKVHIKKIPNENWPEKPPDNAYQALLVDSRECYIGTKHMKKAPK